MQSVLQQWLSLGRNRTGQQTLKQGRPVSLAIKSSEVSAADNVQVLFASTFANHNGSSSSDSEDPVSRGARRYVASITAQRHKDNAVVDTCTVDAAQNSCEVSAADNVTVQFAPAIMLSDSSSSDSEDPVSRGARRYVASLTAQRHRDNAVVDTCTVDAAQNVHDDASDSLADSDVQAMCYCPQPGSIVAQTLRHAIQTICHTLYRCCD
jgi:hypothetical protein